jgi:hypothetical protein
MGIGKEKIALLLLVDMIYLENSSINSGESAINKVLRMLNRFDIFN